MVHVWIRGSVVGVLTMAAASCSGSIVPLPTVDVTGPWSGVVGAGSGGGRAVRVTWTATQTSTNVSGPVTLLTSPAVTDITFSGTVSGTLNGVRLSLILAAAPVGVPGSPNCTATGTGTANALGDTISGTLDVSFTSCDALGLQPPSSNQLTLTKQ